MLYYNIMSYNDTVNYVVDPYLDFMNLIKKSIFYN